MASLQELLAQRAELEKKISDAQREERSAAITKVRTLMADFGLTAADVAGRGSVPRAKTGSGAKVPAKYRNAATGETWSGRGLQPKWLRSALASGRKLEDFAV